MEHQDRLAGVLGFAALLVWALGGLALTTDVLTAYRAADVIVASPLCDEGCAFLPQVSSALATALVLAWGSVCAVGAAGMVWVTTR